MITQHQQDMIDAAKAFLIDFESALKGTKNDMLNRMVEASVMMRREILCAEEVLEQNLTCGYSQDNSAMLRRTIMDATEIMLGDSV